MCFEALRCHACYRSVGSHGLISPAAAEQHTRTELTPAHATAAAELLREALKNRQGDVMHDSLATPVQTRVDAKSVHASLGQRVANDATRVVSLTPCNNTNH